MNESTKKSTIFSSKWFFLAAGLVFGLLAVLLAVTGNPKNMAICVSCFVRDISGALYLQTNDKVQYVRPEIIGIIFGALILSLFRKEHKAMAGSSTMIRFLIGVIMMVGSLVFLGCPLRMVLRMAGGDLNAYVGLIGFVLGVGTGTFFLKKGYSLGEAQTTKKMSGFIIPGIVLLVLILSLATTLLAASTEGPGSMHAPVLISLGVGLIVGGIAQITRLCFSGSFRNTFLMKDFTLLIVVGSLFLVVLIYNIISGNFNLSFADQPIAQPEHLWNILGLYAVGFGAVLAGGCPLRQLVLTGQGSSDGGAVFLGLLVGAAVVHNFGLASSPEGATMGGKIALSVSILILFLIAILNRNKKTA